VNVMRLVARVVTRKTADLSSSLDRTIPNPRCHASYA
jgi:hypothetical protein